MLDKLIEYLQPYTKKLISGIENISTVQKLRAYKIMVGLFLLLVTTYYLSFQYFERPINVKVGDIADFDIRVPQDIEYMQPVETRREQERSRSRVLKVYDRDQSIMTSGLEDLKQFIESIELANRRENQDEIKPLPDIIYALRQKLPKLIDLEDQILIDFIRNNRQNLLANKTMELYITIMDQAILPTKERNDEISENINLRIINSREEIPEQTRNFKDIDNIEQVKEGVYKIAREKFPTLEKDLLTAVVEVSKKFLKPNLFYNEAETYRRMEAAVKNTAPIKGLLKERQIIVRYGEPITQDKYNKIVIINQYRSKGNVSKIFGLFLMQLVLGGLIINFIQRFTIVKFKDAKNITILSLLIFFMATVIFLISQIDDIFGPGSIFAMLVPIAFLTLTVSVLYDEKVAIGCGLYISIFIFFISNNEDIASLYVALVTTLLGSYSVSGVKKRTDFLKIGLYIALANIFLVLIIALYQETNTSDLVKLIAIGFLNGIGSSILAFGLIPAIESLFDVTTNFKLLELTDLSTQLLHTMLFKAPGTYQHSIAVASLAESACQSISANSLLAKVGIYYHDIGKIKRPELFIENQPPGSKNPHTLLTPYESSQVIIDHVRYGLELIDNNHLPKIIKEFITGHHGKASIRYFYHKALESAGPNEEIHKEDYMYPGPNPRRKETGIAMLADSIEAASRTLQKPITRQKIDTLVKSIVSSKIDEGLLDECDLTLADLKKVSDSFVKVLEGIFHNRIEYPDEQKTKILEEKSHNKSNQFQTKAKQRLASVKNKYLSDKP